jgi:hypothetical protein
MAWQPVSVPRIAIAAMRRAARWKDLAGIGV